MYPNKGQLCSVYLNISVARLMFKYSFHGKQRLCDIITYRLHLITQVNLLGRYNY